MSDPPAGRVPGPAPVSSAVPRVRDWRRRLRRARRGRSTRSRGELLSDLYMMLWLVLVYGTILVSAVQRHLATPPGPAALVREQAWIGLAALLATAGLAWQGLRALGPLLASPAVQSWGASTPIDRGGLLRPRFLGLWLSCALAGALATTVADVLALHGAGLGAVALAGAAFGSVGAAAAVLAQGARPPRRWATPLGPGLLIGAGAVALVAVAAQRTGRLLPEPTWSLGPALALAGALLAAAALAPVARGLRRIDRATLSAGAPVAGAAVAAGVSLDVSVLSAVLEQRRWRRVGRVRGRPLRPLFRGRVAALLQAELRRLARRPGSMAVWLGLVLAQYAMAAVAPSLAGVAHVLGAYLAAGRLAGGLRVVGRSPALRRSLGGDEWSLRLAHLALPALGTLLWWIVTLPAGGPPLGPAGVFVLAGVVAAAYRAATRPPLRYDAPMLETPFASVPAELILQLARGPDLLALVIAVQVLLAR